jgi:predicted aspartyl protease
MTLLLLMVWRTSASLLFAQATVNAQSGQPSPGAVALQTLIDRHDYFQTGPTGTWLVEGDGTSFPWTVALRVDGPVLTGTVKTCASTQMSLEIYDGRVDGNTIAFKCKSADGNRTISLTGQLRGDEITFTWEKQVQGNNAFPRDGMFGEAAQPRFTAKRVRNAELSYAYPSSAAEALEKLLDSHDYMEIARTLPKAKGLTPEERLYFTGMLSYRQGRFDDAVKSLTAAAIRTPGASLTAFFIKTSLETLGDIAARSYQYARYAQMYDDVDKIFSARLGNLMGSAFGEKRAIADVLRNVPAQTVRISGDFSLKKTGDGMGEYPIGIGGKNASAGLDTGAMFSLLSESTAKSWGVTPLTGTVTFHGYSSDTFTAHPALIPVLHIGKAELHNVVVFVTADQNLYFAEIKKQIHALLGYPVISALGRLTFTRNGTLTVSVQSTNTTRDDEAALWVGDSTLLISLNTVPIVDKGKVTGGAEPRLFQLDTGSRDTIITDRYLAEHRDTFTGPPTDTARLAGSGGIRAIPAYSARNLPLAFGSTWVTLNGDHVLTESQGGEAENYFGVIGQNLLHLFSSYTIDFRSLRFSIAP